ncbi:MAG: efflux RND transporter periplasmic adaptor subunit [Tannerellaceae bacterium]
MRKTIIYVCTLCLMYACNTEKQQTEAISQPAAASTEAASSVAFNDEQKSLAQIETTTMQKEMISHSIDCNGTIQAPPQQKATITPIVGGVVKSVSILPGQFVNKGATIVTLDNPEFIQLQQEYLENNAAYKYMQKEITRQETLKNEQATSGKKLEQTIAEYETLKSKLQAAEAQLTILGINPQEIQRNGIMPSLALKAPISGYISNVDVNTGKLVEPGQTICNIIDKQKLYIKLMIFEKDLPEVAIGNPVVFNLTSNMDKRYNAKIISIAEDVNAENRTTEAIAEIEDKASIFRPGMYVNAQVKADSRETSVLPESALIREGSNYFVFTDKNGQYHRHLAERGILDNGKVEILNASIFPEGTIFVSKGVFYVNTQLAHKEE